MKPTLTPLALLLAAAATLGAPSSRAADAPKPAPVAPAASPVKEIIVVIKTHFDIGYTHRVKDVIPYYRTSMIDKALAGMDASKALPADQRFSWTGPGWVMTKALEDWPGQTPERRKRLDAAVASGMFQFHALPFSLESDACEPEEMARGYTFASQLSRKYGKPLPIAGKMSDVPSHGGALETVLAHGGVKFMHIGGNWPSGYVTTPGLFWWEGPDGSRTLTLYNGTYGSATGFNWPDGWQAPGYLGRHFMPPANWPYKIWPAIMVTMDNSGPPSPAQIKSYFDEAQKKFPDAKIRMGTMDDFARAFLAENPELPVVKGEMPDTWIHGIMCDPGGSTLSRATHARIASAEALRTELGLWGAGLPPVAREVADAYENILLYGEHTWGVAPAVHQYGEAFAKTPKNLIANLEASWDDKTDYIRKADTISRAIEADNLKALAKSVKAAAGDIIVYNPLPWSRSGHVSVGGRTIEVNDVPPCGYKTVTAGPAAVAASAFAANTIENARYRIAFDAAGGRIASLVDKRTGREWVDTSAERGLGAYLNERFTYEQTLAYTTKYQMGRYGPHGGMHKPGMISEKVTPYRAAVSANGTLTVSTDGTVSTAVLACPADPANHKPATELRVTLPAAGDDIGLEMTIKDKARDNWPEADWFCLPFKVASPKFQVHRQLGVMDPSTDILPGANRDLFTVGHGVTITDADGAGIAIAPIDHPLVSLDRPGCWKFSKDADDFTPTKPVVYLNLYNNQWNTNFRYWYAGTWSSRVRIHTFDAKTPKDAVIATPALEARNPLLAVVAEGGSGTLPASRAGLAVSRPGTLVTAFGTNPDGAGTLLRVWEMAGVAGELTVTLPVEAKFTTATPVDLRGEKTGEPVKIVNGKLTFPLKGYAPASFLLH